jgi:uncharacterized protein (TIGR03435 family)
MADLAQDLQMMASADIDHSVVDATGLDGGWDFLMGWTAKAQLERAQQANPNRARLRPRTRAELRHSRQSSANSA